MMTPHQGSRFVPFLLAVGFWILGAHHRSLWQDEFHSLYHARAENLTALFASVATDNHPPLSFLLIHVSREIFGENLWSLRLPSLFAGCLLLFLVQELARYLRDPFARALWPWLVACSSYVLWIATAARMYALVAAAALGLLLVLVRFMETGRGRLGIALWTALGLHTHYLFFHVLAVVAFTFAWLWMRLPPQRPQLARAFGAGCAGVLLFLPWGAYAFMDQLRSGAPPTGTYHGFDVWSQSYAHMLFMEVASAGTRVRHLAVFPGVLVAAGLVASGTFTLLCRPDRTDHTDRPDPDRPDPTQTPHRRVFIVLLIALGLGLPTWQYVASLFHERSGFHLKYLACSAAPFLALLAAGSSRSLPARVAGVLVLLCMATLTWTVACSPGREDLRGAVAFVLHQARSGDAVLVTPEWTHDPEHSPTAFEWFAQRTDHKHAWPVAIPTPRANDALTYERAWLIHRDGCPRWILSQLEKHFGYCEERPFGLGCTVMLYSKSPSGPLQGLADVLPEVQAAER